MTDRAPLGYLAFYFAGGFFAMMTQTMMTLLFDSAPDARVPNLGASGRHRRGVGRLLRALPRLAHNHVRALVPGADPAWFFLGARLLYQLIEATSGCSAQRRTAASSRSSPTSAASSMASSSPWCSPVRGASHPKAALPSCALLTERQDRDAIAGTAAQGER